VNDVVDGELTLRDYWRVVARRKWLVLTGTLAVVLGALGMSLAQSPIYEARSQMLVQSRSTETLFDASTGRVVDPERALQTEIEVLESGIVAQRVQADLGLAGPPPQVDASSVGRTDVVSVRVRSGDPETARILADAYVAAYIDIRREQAVDDLLSASVELQSKVDQLQVQIDELDNSIARTRPGDTAVIASLTQQRQALLAQQLLFQQKLDQLQVDAALKSGGAQLVRQAERPTSPVEPDPARAVALAVMVGLLLGLGAAFLVDYTDDSIRSADELERLVDLPALAVIPVDPPPDNRPVAMSRPGDLAVEAYRTLRTNVHFMGVDRPLKVIQVTSPLASEGKTTTAANLAVVLSQAGDRVLLIDADLRKPRVHELFGLDGSAGLTNALLGEAPGLRIRDLTDHLAVIPAGEIPPNPSEMLSSRRIGEILRTLASGFDYVIVDSAPLLPVTDSVALSRSVDGVIVVTQAGRTTKKQVTNALDQLQQVSAPLLGLVLNKAASGRRPSVYGYGYGYGHAAVAAVPVGQLGTGTGSAVGGAGPGPDTPALDGSWPRPSTPPAPGGFSPPQRHES
jgi:polysaccharide biosynthesis transport protein